MFSITHILILPTLKECPILIHLLQLPIDQFLNLFHLVMFLDQLSRAQCFLVPVFCGTVFHDVEDCFDLRGGLEAEGRVR
jgi:hypothetical protein